MYQCLGGDENGISHLICQHRHIEMLLLLERKIDISGLHSHFICLYDV